jgi:hypothetical protein
LLLLRETLLWVPLLVVEVVLLLLREPPTILAPTLVAHPPLVPAVVPAIHGDHLSERAGEGQRGRELAKNTPRKQTPPPHLQEIGYKP